MWGPTGITRLFGSEMGTQISWLIPAALVMVLGALWLTRREGRTSKLRAATVLWGTTLIVSGLILSLSKGIIHPYYTVALAPAIGALVGIGGTELWRHRERWTSRVFLSAAIAVTTWWAHVLLGRTPTFESWLRPTILVVGIAAAVTVLVIGHVKRGIAVAIAAGSVLTAVGAPVAFAIDTASTPHTGSIPSAGPSSGSGWTGRLRRSRIRRWPAGCGPGRNTADRNDRWNASERRHRLRPTDRDDGYDRHDRACWWVRRRSRTRRRRAARQ